MKELSLSFGHFKREDELPLTIIVNGCTYQSQPLVDATKKTYFEMGKQHGMELGSDNTYSDKEMSRMHDAWYDEGYAAGRRDQFNDDGELFEKANARNVNLIDEVREKSRKLGYDEGYEAGKKEATSDIEMQWMHDQWYNEGYADGYKQGKQAGKKANGISKKEIPGEYLAHIEEARLEGYKEGYSDAKEGGQAEGYEDYITGRQKTSFVDWLNRK